MRLTSTASARQENRTSLVQNLDTWARRSHCRLTRDQCATYFGIPTAGLDVVNEVSGFLDDLNTFKHTPRECGKIDRLVLGEKRGSSGMQNACSKL